MVGRMACKQEEEQHAYGINIAGRRKHSNGLFWRNIGGIAFLHLCDDGIALLVYTLHTEVRELQVFYVRHQDAGGLDIAMHNLVFMRNL